MDEQVQKKLNKLHKLPLTRLMPIRQALFTPVHLPLSAFRQKVKLHIERERFLIKTAENEQELARVLRLRYEVFYRELLEKRLLLGMDLDKFDFRCDHLIIIEKKTGTYIGTFRLISSHFSKKFYSATEFHLDPILNLNGVKLELGRACVHKDYRTGSTIALLWRGITEYMKETGTRYLFGCSSIKTTDRTEIAALYRTFESNGQLAEPSLRVEPKRRFRIKTFTGDCEGITQEHLAGVPALVPPLISFYLHMGARFCGEPALDKKFKCADFLTLFNIESITVSAQRKYRL